MAGRFITFEGVEGSGKTTQLARLARVLQRRGLDVVATREPGGTELGNRLRALILDPETRPVPYAELFMLLADRAQHVAEVIRPALSRGAWVLADRFSDATRAYQIGGRGLDPDLVERALEAATSGLCPDLTLLLDLDVDTGTGRARERGALNRLDRESLEFHRRVRDAYNRRMQLEPDRIKLVQAALDEDAVHAIVMEHVEALFG